MKMMIATIGICVAMAVAGCAQKTTDSTTLAAFGDEAKSCCPLSGAGCTAAQKAECSAAKKAQFSKAKASGCCAASKNSTTEEN